MCSCARPGVDVVALEVVEGQDGVGDGYNGDKIVEEGERQEHIREGHAARTKLGGESLTRRDEGGSGAKNLTSVSATQWSGGNRERATLMFTCYTGLTTRDGARCNLPCS